MRGSKRAGYAAHIGGRPVQQDRAACFVSADGTVHLLVVADGMGGRQGGDLAAQVVIDTAARLWGGRADPPADPGAFLETLCQEAHAEIRRGAQDGGEAGGSTVAALLATPERAWWVHVGDSRVYGFRDGLPVCRTEDHTVVQQLVRCGRIDADAVAAHPEQNKLLRGLGADETVQTTHGQMQVSAGTGFVLCTDGFWERVSGAEMAGLLREADAAAACTRWVEIAAGRGGADGDNATVAVLQPAGEPLRMAHRQLWPLYAAVFAALAMGLFHAFR
ncbi:PP2C family protein-serine/threonine phosphatase [Pseudothauera rhizosphaerae]|uniref:Serine/threonine-protein phosphatase n=1 Tax=Pseudothauera rhizosphaerae TaxID=2565932 RepID=A0A4S4ANF0_9RHOO|nr:protein phosphatase 2C domain-containing protein [Pseudothauera rhizosphaerae]THF61176.1 serine/threonine-protein phosphatase [Pseudothauera rhizosphaerae]